MASITCKDIVYKLKPQIVFFLKRNQQFIIWSAMADYSSYFVTTYIETETT